MSLAPGWKPKCDFSVLTVGNYKDFRWQPHRGNLRSPHQAWFTANALQSQKRTAVKDSGRSGYLCSYRDLHSSPSCLHLRSLYESRGHDWRGTL